MAQIVSPKGIQAELTKKIWRKYAFPNAINEIVAIAIIAFSQIINS